MNDEPDWQGLARKLIEQAYWNVFYHEERLAVEHRKLGLVQSLIIRTGVPVNMERARNVFDDDEEGQELISSEDVALHTLGAAMNGVCYHEDELRDAYRALAKTKALLIRAGMEDVAPFDKAEEAARERLAKSRK